MMEGWMDGQIEGWLDDRQTKGQMDGQMDVVEQKGSESSLSLPNRRKTAVITCLLLRLVPAYGRSLTSTHTDNDHNAHLVRSVSRTCVFIHSNQVTHDPAPYRVLLFSLVALDLILSYFYLVTSLINTPIMWHQHPGAKQIDSKRSTTKQICFYILFKDIKKLGFFPDN